MPKITLLQKIYGENKPETFQKTLNKLFEELKVKTRICNVTSRGWIQLEVSGEDQNFALNYLKKTFGICPEKLENLTKFSNITGRILDPEKDKTGIHVDIGVFNPKTVDAFVSLQNLQAQLLDGKKLPLPKIIELFGFSENFPLTVKLSEIDLEKGKVNAVLSEQQLSLFSRWVGTLLDKLLVFGATSSAVKYAVRKSRYLRSVIGFESLGVLEHAIACKLGTQAVGLIPRIGKILPQASLRPFSPRKIIEYRSF